MFNKFAEKSANVVSGSWFFIGCITLILVWLFSYFIIPSVNTWELIINTLTTIITFILVALLQNSQKRFEDATSDKLNAIADGLADFMEVNNDLDSRHAHELRKAVGSEKVDN